MKRNDPGINGLDQACKQHDIAYDKHSDQLERNKADDILAKQAWKRVKSSEAGIGERAAALGVAGLMKIKSKLGMGSKKRKKGCDPSPKRRTVRKKKNLKRKKKHVVRRKKQTSAKRKVIKRKRKVSNKVRPDQLKKMFRSAVQSAKKTIASENPQTIGEATKLAFAAATKAVKIRSKIPKKEVLNALPRIIPVPKLGGALPLIPIFAGLSALGALIGGSSTLANAVVSANSAKQQLREANRHNETMEAIAIGKTNKSGSGLYIKPYKKGFGLYLKPYGFKSDPKN